MIQRDQPLFKKTLDESTPYVKQWTQGKTSSNHGWVLLAWMLYSATAAFFFGEAVGESL
jgi:hypothetical protein